MSITSNVKAGIVTNVLDYEDDLDDFLAYAAKHIDGWTDYQVLWDLTRLNFIAVTAESIRNLISNGREVATERSGLKTAFLIESDPGVWNDADV